MSQRTEHTPRNAWTVREAAADFRRPSLAERALTVAALPKPITFDLSRSAVIVIDMQNDFCHPDGWLARIGVDVTPARAPIGRLQALLPAVRGASVPVVWVNWGNRPDLANISPALRHVFDPAGAGSGLGASTGPDGAKVLTKDSWSAAVVDELEAVPGDVKVDKFRMSGFWDTPLDSILRNLRVDTLFFAGVNADQCVLHTLADANFLGYDTVLLEDATATTSPDFCMAATLYNVRQIFGFTVTSTDLIGAIGAAS
ncbi:MAG: isochorismatase family cysteine hydrolase [Pseudomonadota bacterium]